MRSRKCGGGGVAPVREREAAGEKGRVHGRRRRNRGNARQVRVHNPITAAKNAAPHQGLHVHCLPIVRVYREELLQELSRIDILLQAVLSRCGIVQRIPLDPLAGSQLLQELRRLRSDHVGRRRGDFRGRTFMPAFMSSDDFWWMRHQAYVNFLASTSSPSSSASK